MRPCLSNPRSVQAPELPDCAQPTTDYMFHHSSFLTFADGWARASEPWCLEIEGFAVARAWSFGIGVFGTCLQGNQVRLE